MGKKLNVSKEKSPSPLGQSRDKKPKIRLDQLLLQRGLMETLAQAQARIMAGDVIVDDHRVDKPSDKFYLDAAIRIKGNSHHYVSRGGLKLEHALKSWPVDLVGAVCMDVGASTGGFTQVLLEQGARMVYAIDVGHGQLAYSLQSDARVINRERSHILELEPSSFSEVPVVAVVDVSFISLTKVLPKVFSLVATGGMVYALIKPQFEVGRAQIEKGGIVKDEGVRQAVVEKIIQLVAEAGFTVVGVEPSPILGTKGNVEFLIAIKT